MTMASESLDESVAERLAIMLEAHPDITTDEAIEAARAYRGQDLSLAQQLARREQDAGRDGRQVMRAVQWLAGSWGSFEPRRGNYLYAALAHDAS